MENYQGRNQNRDTAEHTLPAHQLVQGSGLYLPNQISHFLEVALIGYGGRVSKYHQISVCVLFIQQPFPWMLCLNQESF